MIDALAERVTGLAAMMDGQSAARGSEADDDSFAPLSHGLLDHP
jgi:hypothetical protein